MPIRKESLTLLGRVGGGGDPWLGPPVGGTLWVPSASRWSWRSRELPGQPPWGQQGDPRAGVAAVVSICACFSVCSILGLQARTGSDSERKGEEAEGVSETPQNRGLPGHQPSPRAERSPACDAHLLCAGWHKGWALLCILANRVLSVLSV